MLNKERSGRPQKLTLREERKVVSIVKKTPKILTSEITAEIQEHHGKQVHPRTIRRTLHRAGYHAQVPRRKPFIIKVNEKKRLEFAQEYIMTDDGFWKKVFFSDESKFNIFRHHGSFSVEEKEHRA